MRINYVDVVKGITGKLQQQKMYYQDNFEKDVSQRTDEDSKFVRVVQSLSDDEKKLLMDFIHRCIVDTTAGIFSWLDGSSFLEGIPHGELELKYKEGSNILNGYLTDIFLAIEEGEGIAELRKFYDDDILYED